MWKYLQNVSKPPEKKQWTDSDKHCYDKKYDETTWHKNYRGTWSVTFPWVRYDSDKNLIFSKTCEQFQEKTSESSFVTGCSSFRKENISLHNVSQCHKLCSEMKNSRNAEPEKLVAEKALQSLNKEALQKISILFRNSHAIAKHGRPFTDFKWLCELDKKKGLDIGETYITDKKCAEFINFVGSVEQKKLEECLKTAPFFSILCDDATECAVLEQVIVYTRYCVEGNVRVYFVALNMLKDQMLHRFMSAL
ncbi:hypothetical protein PR048_015950 [Dryococelus australis]|uniref:C17orf113 probable zinc finger domain-containing protein n=1 Tax=Dryococelus australis TaxID=614101 RepID=A0ABQ9HJH8_9NEOP|nr:hypothetical protein PR048_015950 [Dryococelus australis]